MDLVPCDDRPVGSVVQATIWRATDPVFDSLLGRGDFPGGVMIVA